jgi:16S rRNA C967 or C1407 C5-methylase (RsmB/RsmF family)
MKTKVTGRQKFEDHYTQTYGDRWSDLREALLRPVEHIGLPQVEVWRELGLDSDPALEGASFELPPGTRAYYLDYASIFAPLALEVSPGDEVLDMCAAPGGKSLILARALKGKGRLLATDRSKPRAHRLERVLDEFLLPVEKSVCTVAVRDGKTLGLSLKEEFSKILLDAPCSSERHLLHAPEELEQWSLMRSKRLSKEQGTLLCSALMALRPGGRLVYSTCSLSPLENDGLMAWFEKKRAGQFRFVKRDYPFGEETTYGHLFLPDRGGHGPLYICVMEKNL